MPIEPVDAATIRKRVETYFSARNEVFIHVAIYIAVNLGAVGFVSFTEMGWLWPLLLLLTWGVGLAGHILEVLAKTPRRLAQTDHDAFDQMAQIYGPDWQETASEADYKRIYKRAHQALNQKKEFIIHAVVYVGVSLAAWLFWTGIAEGNPVMPLLLMLCWGIGLIVHGISIYGSTAQAANRREQAIQQAVEREQAWLYGAVDGGGKAKRKRQPDTQRLMRTNDGEMLEVAEEDWENDDQSAHLNTRG